MGIIRALLFYTGYALATLLWGTLSVLVAWMMPYRKRFDFVIGNWTRFVLWWLQCTCGIRHKLYGEENIPEQACVVLAKHQSTWETLYLQQLFAPQATVMKRELLNIPFFGWALRLLKPIGIDRKRRTSALRQLINRGRHRLDENIWVVLLPEGTRTDHGTKARFHRGGAKLAHAAERPVLVVAHNAGLYWPARKFTKRPGTIQISVSPPIPSEGLSVTELNDAAQAWLEQEMVKILARTPPEDIAAAEREAAALAAEVEKQEQEQVEKDKELARDAEEAAARKDREQDR